MKKIYFILLISITATSQVQIGTDINGETSFNYSSRVTMSADGTFLAIGAMQNDGNGNDSGHVRVFQNVSGNWTQVGTDINGEAGDDYSGSSVSFSSDGTILAIGAIGNNGNGSDSGHVRVYRNNAGTWTQVGADINGEATNDGFGFSVSLSSDGTILAIGSPQNDGNGVDSGHVRIYRNTAGTWTQIGSEINGEAAGDYFGFKVSLSSDGNIVAVGAYFNDGNGADSGHVRVFQNISDTWTQIGVDINGEAANDNSGAGISLSADGSIVAIGASGNDGNIFNSGHVRVFKNTAGTWTQVGNDIDGEAILDNSGKSISLSADGTILAIGTEDNDGNGTSSGHVRIFKNISNNWTQIGTDINGEAANDFSGISISLSSNGNRIAIGAANNDGNGTDSGHVRVFELSSLANESFEKHEFIFYPNPVKDILTIEVSDNFNEEISIVDISGKTIKKQTISNQFKTINVSDLKSGMYFIQFKNQEYRTFKFIKN